LKQPEGPLQTKERPEEQRPEEQRPEEQRPEEQRQENPFRTLL
jgi:hypothetical protein